MKERIIATVAVLLTISILISQTDSSHHIDPQGGFSVISQRDDKLSHQITDFCFADQTYESAQDPQSDYDLENVDCASCSYQTYLKICLNDCNL